MLGKGAYGKVWEGLLDSAQLIAVKEVELDFVNLEKAQSVSTCTPTPHTHTTHHIPHTTHTHHTHTAI